MFIYWFMTMDICCLFNTTNHCTDIDCMSLPADCCFEGLSAALMLIMRQLGNEVCFICGRRERSQKVICLMPSTAVDFLGLQALTWRRLKCIVFLQMWYKHPGKLSHKKLIYKWVFEKHALKAKHPK